MPEVVLLAAARTPIGAFQGTLAEVAAPTLGAVAIGAALKRAGIDPADVSDVLLGQVLQAGVGQAPARQAALSAGLPPRTRCTTVHKVCGSGLEAVVLGARALALGEATCVVAGGMESMSGAPFLLPSARRGLRLGHAQLVDSILHDGLLDPHENLPMGACAEACAARYGLTREAQDAFAIQSYRRAQAAQQAEAFTAELAPVPLPATRNTPATEVDRDEGPGLARFEKIPRLKPAFSSDGTITAANASSLNDGAAALVLATAATARDRGLPPLARLVATTAHAHEPLWFTTAPVNAIRQVLVRADWAIDDVDLWEINEAFAVVPLACQHDLGLDPDRVNVHGGAIALGHPIGASGARILTTLIHALRLRGGRRGVAAICIGGGEALAVAVELL